IKGAGVTVWAPAPIGQAGIARHRDAAEGGHTTWLRILHWPLRRDALPIDLPRNCDRRIADSSCQARPRRSPLPSLLARQLEKFDVPVPPPARTGRVPYR